MKEDAVIRYEEIWVSYISDVTNQEVYCMEDWSHVASECAASVPEVFHYNNATSPGQRNSRNDCCVSVHSDPKSTVASFLLSAI